MCVWTTPCVDLQYFLHTSPSLEVYKDHSESLLKNYYDELSRCLTSLGCRDDVPGFEEFMGEYKSRFYIGFLATATVLPLVRAPQRDDATFEDLMADNDKEGGIRHAAYNNEGYKKTMEYFIEKFDGLGLLD